MTAPKKHWYLIAYDVRDAKRLQRVHRLLRKRAIPLQESVFLLHSDSALLQDIEAGLRARSDTRVDDLRLYSVPGPEAIWAAGRQRAVVTGLFPEEPRDSARGNLRHWFKGLFGREAA